MVPLIDDPEANAGVGTACLPARLDDGAQRARPIAPALPEPSPGWGR